jgi:demethylmenaquinone methyltransferase/2-methoxy-6-polyprenyl-1,4-benzoquinol methylase
LPQFEEIRPDRPATIRRMFDSLAPDYDRLNTLLTFGMVRGWRRALVRAARVGSGGRVLDVACGTGRSLAEARRAAGSRGLAVGVDFTEAMLRRASGHRVLGDGLRLPFADAAFDAAISAFALRDVADQALFLSEMARVTRPGGRVAVLEIGRPLRQPLRLGFDLWFRGAVPRVAALMGQAQSHRFLVRSLSFLASPPELARMIEGVGIERVVWRDLSLGAARVFAGTRQDRRARSNAARGR